MSAAQRPGPSLQRRLLLWLLLGAPLVWAAALAVSAHRARVEVNELFDTEMIRFARQVQATLADAPRSAQAPPAVPGAASGDADLRDLAIAAWDAQGRLRVVDREGAQLPFRGDAAGFVDLTIAGDPWRVFYLQSARGDTIVAAGQRLHERDELVSNLIYSQGLPWLLMLPALLAVMAWAVRRALAPMRELARELQGRRADEQQPIGMQHAPAELRPLLAAMNDLFGRIGRLLEHERRFTADAAHELRTPLAALRAQWDVLRRAAGPDERRAAEARFGDGLDRLHRLVTQMLALSRLEATEQLTQTRSVDWPRIVRQVMGDCLALAERRRIELACEWPAGAAAPFPLKGDEDLLAALLRNLLDNAVRYAPAGSEVTLRFGLHAVAVENEGPPLAPETQAQLGQRFRRADGQSESGSGLGVSIVRRIAALHGLALRYRTRAGGTGVVAEVTAA